MPRPARQLEGRGQRRHAAAQDRYPLLLHRCFTHLVLLDLPDVWGCLSAELGQRALGLRGLVGHAHRLRGSSRAAEDERRERALPRERALATEEEQVRRHADPEQQREEAHRGARAARALRERARRRALGEAAAPEVEVDLRGAVSAVGERQRRRARPRDHGQDAVGGLLGAGEVAEAAVRERREAEPDVLGAAVGVALERGARSSRCSSASASRPSRTRQRATAYQPKASCWWFSRARADATSEPYASAGA